MSVSKDILSFYRDKDNPKNHWFLHKYFTNTSNLGFYKPFDQNPVHSAPDGSSYIGTVDEHNTYKINRLGFRGQVYENPDILAFGCSITFGLGIPELGRWPEILSNKTNKDITNLGNPGASIKTICNNIIQYCMQNKMPKEIFCLMPDFFRNMVVVDKEFYNSKLKRGDVEKIDGLSLIFCNPRVMPYEDGLFMEITDKKYIEDYTSPHQLIFDAINNLYILESFCLSNNIKLYWTTWHLPSSLIMEQLTKLEGFKLKNFYPFMLNDKTENLNEYTKNRCNSSHNSEFKDDLCWSKGSDYSIENYKKTIGRAHPGIHFQYHVAEFFYELCIA